MMRSNRHVHFNINLSGRKRFWLCWACFLIVFSYSWAQESDSLSRADSVGIALDSIDTLRQRQLEATPFLTDAEMIDSLLVDTFEQVEEPVIPVLTSDTVAVFLLRRVEDLALTLNQIERQLQQPLDTSGLKLPTVDRELTIIEQYYSRASNSYMDLRTLNSIETIIEEVEVRLERFEEDLLEYDRQLIRYRSSMEGIERDSLNRLLPRDPVLRASYIEQLNDITQRYQRVSELLRARLLQLGLLQNRVTRLSIRLNDLDAQTERMISQYRNNIIRPNHPPLWQLRKDYYRGKLKNVTSFSLRMAGDTLGYFFRYNWGIRLINIGLILFFYIFSRIMIAKIRRKHPDDATAVLSPVTYFDSLPEISAVVAGLTIVPFVYGTPPLAFVQIIWTALFTLLSWLLAKRFTKTHLSLWIVLLVLFVFDGIVMLMITTTLEERWVLFGMNLLSVGVGILLLTKGRISKKPAIRYLLSRIVFWTFLILNILALFANLSGYYNLGITFSYTASFQVLYVMALWVFIELMGELAYLYIEANKEELQAYSSWLDYQEMQQRFKRILGFVAVILWTGAVLKSLTLFDLIYEWAYDFLTFPRSIGNATFTYWSLLVFLIIIYISVMISRVLAYVFGNHETLTASGEKNNLGSTMLLVRIAVLGAGMLLALSAAGISLDKVAIVLGALGVGIGFGLQGLFNNLVSGIILAFEKPIKIGDVIELGPFIGKVKEIGIRSSKVVTFDGADVIIPNGDLLSQQLTNWTLSNKKRRIELIVGVGYGSNIPAVREAIQQAINSQEKVMRYPQPMVLVNEFSDSSVNFRVLFWTNRFDEWINIKSEMLTAIYEEFSRVGVEIPFPKRDVFIRFPEETKKKLPESLPLEDSNLENGKNVEPAAEQLNKDKSSEGEE